VIRLELAGDSIIVLAREKIVYPFVVSFCFFFLTRELMMVKNLNCLLMVAGLALALTSFESAHAASITFGPATTILGDTDVYNAGVLEYAYAWSGLSPTVNGVPFTGSTSVVGDGSGDVTWDASFQHSTAYGLGAAAPWTGLSASYQDALRGGDYKQFGPITVSLNNLSIGTPYAVQLWYHDSRDGFPFTQDVTSLGGNLVTLVKNFQNAYGGVGQFTIGTFIADATSQTFTVSSATEYNTQINAIQVRAIPEPSTLTLAALGLIAGLRTVRRRAITREYCKQQSTATARRR
jgi:hypothetical protein